MKKRILCTVLMLIMLIVLTGTNVLAQERTYDFTLQWNVENAENDVQNYQVYRSQPNNPLVMEKFGDPIPFSANASDRPTTLSQQIEVTVTGNEDVAYFWSVTAIDTSGNESYLAKPFVGYRFSDQPPAEPLGLKANEITP